MLSYGRLDGGAMQAEVERFQQSIEDSVPYTLNVNYVNSEKGVSERRSMRAVPLNDSNGKFLHPFTVFCKFCIRCPSLCYLVAFFQVF